jgi:hypothetical protein
MLEEADKAQTRRQALIVWTYIEKKEAFDRSKKGFERNRNEKSEAASHKKNFSKNVTKIAPNPRSSGEEEEEGTATTTTTTSEHSRPLYFLLSFFLVGAGYLPVANTAFIDWFCRRITRISSTDSIYGLHLHMRWLQPGRAFCTGPTPQ